MGSGSGENVVRVRVSVRVRLTWVSCAGVDITGWARVRVRVASRAVPQTLDLKAWALRVEHKGCTFNKCYCTSSEGLHRKGWTFNDCSWIGLEFQDRRIEIKVTYG